MPSSRRKTRREIEAVAAQYGLTYAGLTAKGHFIWRHEATGRTVVSVSSMQSRHALANTERTFKTSIRKFEEASRGQRQD